MRGDEKNPGIIPLAIDDIFDHIKVSFKNYALYF